jgi:ribosomal protein S18 acetylase RimI-like enzyme
LDRNVVNSGVEDRQRVNATISMGFIVDPVARWLYPDSHQFMTSFPSFCGAYGGKAFEHGTAYHTEDFVGALLWLPPNAHPDDELILDHLKKTADPKRLEIFLKVLELMGSFHPKEPHWFLPLIGVDVFHQGSGHGTALLKKSLERVDESRTLAYLDSSNVRNIPLYQRFGFEVIGKVDYGGSPTSYSMLRKIRK